jgi:outer membrane immunogenic protein
MLHRVILTAASVFALTAAANAADMYRPAAGGYKDVPYVGVNWSGFYFGGHAGGAWNGTEFTDYGSSGNVFNQGKLNDDTGFIGGGQIGYNVQSGNLVYGLEVDLGDMERSASVSYPAHNLAPIYSTKGGLYGDVTARVGYTFDKALVYAKGGYAFLDGENKVSYSNSAYSKKDFVSGWTIGGGVEYMVAPAWSVKAEYQHFAFDDVNVATPAEGGNVKFKNNEADAVTAGVNYHLGRSFDGLK